MRPLLPVLLVGVVSFAASAQTIEAQLSRWGYETVSHWHGEWIWSQTDSGPHFTTLWFEREFDLGDAPVDDAALAVAADDSSFVYVNGRPAGAGGNHLQSERLDVAGLLCPGRNKLTVRVFNAVSFGGLICDLHIRQNGRSRFVSSDPEWKYAPGGDTPPNRIDRPVVALGALGTARWNWRLPCRYTGPRAKLEDVSVEEHAFSARCAQLPEPLPRQLRFRVALPDGVTYPLMLDVRIGRKGDFRRFEYAPPFPVNREAGQLYLDDDRFMPLASPVGTVPAAGKAPGLRRARRIRHGGRLKIEFRGKIMEPFFWALPARFQRAWTARTPQVAAAREAGFDNYALLTDFVEFWKEDGSFDFTSLDRKAEQLLSLDPDAVFLLQIGCFMPDWWLQKHPDDVSARFDGKPRNQSYERQALASKRWLRDARIPLAALTEHVRNASWGDRVWGANVAENTNWEWFWWHGRGGKPYVTGASPADVAAFRVMLRRKYATDAELAARWGDPSVTLDTAEMPPAALHRSASVGTLLDTKRDRRLMDWFEFRNLALAEAVIDLCRSLKEFSGGAWLTGAYYGSFVSQCCGVGYPIQDAGHNGFLEVARSPDVDFVRAPASYRHRAPGQSDAAAQPWDTFLRRDKIVYIECDMRTALKFDPVSGDARVSRPATTAQTVEIMNRMFGMMCATGCSYYWYDIADGSFLDPVLIRTLKRQHEIYAALPPVAGLTPPEIAMIGDRDSVYRTKRNNDGDAILPAIAFPLMSGLPKLGAPYRVGCIDDLLDGTLPPCRFYIMFNALMMSAETRQKLMEKFDREKASVLWLYAPGAFYPERGPEAGCCADFLGLKMRMENIRRRPTLAISREWGGGRFDGMGRNTAPWFIPESGFDEAIGRDERDIPVVVTFRRGGATHYFSALPELPPQLLRRMAERAGVHFYVSAGSADPVWIGNDTITLHAASDGEKRLITPPGTKLRRLAGCVGKEELSSGESWHAETGGTCVFQVVRAD